MTSPARSLVLFDIDGTLIRKAGPHHRQALEDAMYQVTGIRATTDTIPVYGMLDGDILRLMFEQAGALSPQFRRALPEIMCKAQNLYVRRCPDLHSKVCPGVRPLLNRLSRRRIPLGLVTGNLSRIGWRKMTRAGIRRHFSVGAFAEDGPTRAALAAEAVQRAAALGLIARDAQVTLVGDHPNDIAAARSAGLRSVAVATGVVPLKELAEHRPDFLVADLRSLDPQWLVSD